MKHIPRDSPDMTPYKICKNGVWPESCDPLNFNWRIYVLSECLLIIIIIITIGSALNPQIAKISANSFDGLI